MKLFWEPRLHLFFFFTKKKKKSFCIYKGCISSWSRFVQWLRVFLACTHKPQCSSCPDRLPSFLLVWEIKLLNVALVYGESASFYPGHRTALDFQLWMKNASWTPALMYREIVIDGRLCEEIYVVPWKVCVAHLQRMKGRMHSKWLLHCYIKSVWINKKFQA